MTTTAVPAADPTPRLWTREEFYRLADLGFFAGQRAERIGGQIVVMSPQNWRHTTAVDMAAEALRAVFAAGFWVRSQAPLELGQSSDPEPDVSVVVGRREDHAGHPTAAVLVVEVADTTLDYDRGPKAGLYAAAGVPDYWVIDVNRRRVEVFRGPTLVPEGGPAAPHGGRYATSTTHDVGDAVTPLAVPVPIPVADLVA